MLKYGNPANYKKITAIIWHCHAHQLIFRHLENNRKISGIILIFLLHGRNHCLYLHPLSERMLIETMVQISVGKAKVFLHPALEATLIERLREYWSVLNKAKAEVKRSKKSQKFLAKKIIDLSLSSQSKINPQGLKIQSEMPSSLNVRRVKKFFETMK